MKTTTLEARIRKLAKQHGHMVYKEAGTGVLVLVGDGVTLLRCVGDEITRREDQLEVVRWLAHISGRGVQAFVVRPGDFSMVAKMIAGGDWRN